MLAQKDLISLTLHGRYLVLLILTSIFSHGTCTSDCCAVLHCVK